MSPRGRHSQKKKKTAPPQGGLTIVGIGASAGGLEACTQLLRALPPTTGCAFVLVQHLAPNHQSALPLLLGGQTAMKVVEAQNGARVEANHLYVIPPNVQLSMSGDQLALRERPSGPGQHTPIDVFLTSLAEEAGSRAVAVILSGSASDGAMGVRAVQEAGGLTIAQSPESARYDGMPKAAIATGAVADVLDPAGIAARLADCAAAPSRVVEPPKPEVPALDDEQLAKIFGLLHTVSGVDFSKYKLPTIKRRLARRMSLQRIPEVDQYLRFMQSSPVEVQRLYQDFLIHVTSFFREPESFKALATYAWPAIARERPPESPLRAWVCGCATGEEAYSLAMALVEYGGRTNRDVPFQIFATDVSEAAIEVARSGVYPARAVEDLGQARARRFFTKIDGRYRINRDVRERIVFARQDITKDPPFSRLDLILCRNVMIYLDVAQQRRVISIFHYALNPGGFLVLGQAESVGSQTGLFSVVDKKHRIHKKKSTPPSPLHFADGGPLAAPPKSSKSPDEPGGGGAKALLSEVNRIVVDRYAPVGVVIDEDLQVVQFRGQTGAFLEPAPGEASLSLLKMAREGLLYGLRTSINAARTTKDIVRKDGLQVREGRGWRPVAIEVVPLATPGRAHYLVLFVEPAPPAQRGKSKGKEKKESKSAARERKTQLDLLKRELAASREYLQSIIQELEAANEELQSANEEILSSNEELQSTNEELDTAKEELQSTNEELNTLNEELHERNDELSRTNGDLVNLVGSVQIAIVIVGSDLRIRRFTPMAEKVMNLIPGDVDRSIEQINPNIDCPDLSNLIRQCMEQVAPVERQVLDKQGREYSLRIRPYKTMDNRIDGAVVALFDIDKPH